MKNKITRGELVALLESADSALSYVVASWESGDLARSVRGAHETREAIRAMLEECEEKKKTPARKTARLLCALKLNPGTGAVDVQPVREGGQRVAFIGEAAARLVAAIPARSRAYLLRGVFIRALVPADML